MAAALLVHGLVTRLIVPRPPAVARQSRFAGVDAHLVVGASLFGVGWGLSGYCPGPALTSLCAGGVPLVVAVVGIGLHDVVMGAPNAAARSEGSTARRLPFMPERRSSASGNLLG